MNNKQKYFIVDDIKVAELIELFINQKYYTFNDKDKDRYSFKYVEGINKAYGKAMRIINNL